MEALKTCFSQALLREYPLVHSHMYMYLSLPTGTLPRYLILNVAVRVDYSVAYFDRIAVFEALHR